MNKIEFEEFYANNSKSTPEELYALGLRAFPCDCRDDDCMGWQMLNKKDN